VVRELIPIKMELNMLENGRMISNMDMEFSSGSMDKFTRDSIKMEQKQEKVSSNSLIKATTRVNLILMKFMEKVIHF
jgi:hypothetical protein